MRTAGIIAEYNPFHNGHAWQIAELKKRGFEAVVCVCSPGVVQRGTAALFPARVRTRAALAAGADLVLSLPAPYATLSAEGFAAAGVALLSALGCVDALCFGTETRRLEDIAQTAALLESPDFPAALRGQLDAGLPLPAARAAAAEALCPGAGAVLRAPNDILGVEYCKALLRQHSALVPLALPRRGAAHDAPLDAAPGRYASASALRALVRAGGAAALAPHVPPACLRLYMQAEAEGDVLDGVPRTVAQAEALEEMGVGIDKVVDIEVSDERIIQRLSGRRVCSACGASYHTTAKPSVKPDVCDRCGGALIVRKDDEPATILERLKVYHELTEPLVDFYRERGKLVVVEGQEEVADTTRLLLEKLGVSL